MRAAPPPLALARSVKGASDQGYFPEVLGNQSVSTPHPTLVKVERAPFTRMKLILYFAPNAENTLTMGAYDDGEILGIFREVHEDRSTGPTFQLAVQAFASHRAQP
jgi:hypothetical protein